MKKSFKKIINKIKQRIKYIKKNVNYIYEKSNNSKISIFFDMIYCKIRYDISINEYRIYEFYLIDDDKRKTYLSIKEHNKMSNKLFDNKINSVISNKKLFNSRFKKYMNAEIYDLSDYNFKSFEEYIMKNKIIIARSKSNSFIKSYKVYDIKDFRGPAFISDSIKKNNLSIIEKKYSQKKELNEISDLVIINITSVFSDGVYIISSSIKYKENEQIYTGFIDYKKGIIKGNIKDEKGLNVTDKFNKFEIPSYDKIKKLVFELAKELEEINEIEWSFIVDNIGNVHLIDANKWEDYVFAQTPEFLNNRIGLRGFYKRIEKK